MPKPHELHRKRASGVILALGEGRWQSKLLDPGPKSGLHCSPVWLNLGLTGACIPSPIKWGH